MRGGLVGSRDRILWRTSAEPTQRRRRGRLYHAWRPLSARKRLHYLDRDLRRPESRAAWACGARWPRRARAAALSPAHSVTETPPSPPLSRQAGCLRMPTPAAPRQGPIYAHEPRGGFGEEGGRHLLFFSAEPTRRRRRRRLDHARRRVSARQRLHYFCRDLRRPESRAEWARNMRWPRRTRAAALGLAHSVAGTPRRRLCHAW